MDKNKRIDELIKSVTCPLAEKWSRQNHWYGRDFFLTNRALDIHRQLVDIDKIDPKTQKYYDEIDKRIYTLYKKRLKKYFSMDN